MKLKKSTRYTRAGLHLSEGRHAVLNAAASCYFRLCLAASFAVSLSQNPLYSGELYDDHTKYRECSAVSAGSSFHRWKHDTYNNFVVNQYVAPHSLAIAVEQISERRMQWTAKHMAIAVQVYYLLWVSISMALVALALFASSGCYISFFIGPTAFAFSVIHHIILIIFIIKERRGSLEKLASRIEFRPTSQKETIVFTCISAFLWAAAGCTALTNTGLSIRDSEGGVAENPILFAIGFLEGLFELVEGVVVVFIALRCIQQRQCVAAMGDAGEQGDI